MSMGADAEFWNRAAPKYAAGPIADQGGYERTLERVRGLLGPGDRVLELGCGTGSTALRLAGGTAGYVAADFSARMIAIAKDKAAGAPSARLSFRVAAAEALAAEDERYDAVLGFNYLHLVSDLRQTLTCIHDLLEPGGLFVSKSTCLADMNPFMRLVIRLMQLVGRAPYVNIFSEVALQDEIRRAGFRIVACEHHATRGRDRRPVIVARKSDS
jgi:ubiquinone/menaquinone biosynthesis C-methylase UbiE